MAGLKRCAGSADEVVDPSTDLLVTDPLRATAASPHRPLGESVPAAAPVPGRSTPRRQVTIVIGLVLAVFVIGAALAALLRVTVAERGPDGRIVEAGQLPSAELQPGDCFGVPPESTSEVAVVSALPCEAPHDLEVFHIYDSTIESAFPGADGFLDEAQTRCLPAFRSYVGVDASASAFRIFTVVPSDESWRTGDRRIVCAVYEPGVLSTGSARGASR